MKRLLNILALSILFIGLSAVSFGQVSNNELSKPIPLDSKILTGKLDNGLTYYIRQNDKPENKVELRLVVNAGSILEDDDQQGLAHFCEHMCFNGTKHFEKNELVSYLQSLGIEFGGDLNAYTSFDQTVYMLPVPSEDPETIDKGLLVLSDWANGVLFTDEEIDKEKGVILEELRIGQGAGQRMRDEYFPVVFKNSMYANRLPIGKKHLLETFDHERIRSFYKEWYRPDLMAVIAVGDLEPEAMKKKIEQKFGSIQMPENYRPRKLFEVPDHQETYVSVVSDREAAYTVVQLIYKDDIQNTDNWNDYRRNLKQSLYNGMLRARLSELTKSAHPPFMFANTNYGGFVRTKNAYTSVAIVGPDGIETGLKTLLKENQRVKTHGFTQTELDRYKKEYLTKLEEAFHEKDKTESASYVGEYINHFLDGEPSPGIEAEYEFTQKALPGITLNEVNELAKDWIKDYNRVVVIMAPEKDGIVLPTEEEVKNWMNEAETETVEVYVDAISDRPLMENTPKAAEIISSRKNEELGITTIAFDNGIKVLIKPTDFKNDEILMSAYSFGGSSLYNDEEFKSAAMGGELVRESGVNNFSKIELEKLLSGKNLRVSPYISSIQEGFYGNTTPNDFETFLQLINLYFTKPNFNQEAFESNINKQKMYYPNLLQDPSQYFKDQVKHILADNHIRGGYIPTMEDLESLDFNTAKKAYTERFANPGHFTFFFVGNINLDDHLKLIQQYLGSLEGQAEKSGFIDRGMRSPSGPKELTIFKGQDEKSQVNIFFTHEHSYDYKENYLLKSLGEVLTIKLIENLREEKSGVYGVGAYGYFTKNPYSRYKFVISFPCGPKNTEGLIKAALAEMENIKENGPSQEDIDKVKENQRLDNIENLEKNRYWLNSIQNAYANNTKLSHIINKQALIDDLSIKSMQKTAKKYIKEHAKIQVVLMPENK